jgi:hypothetical protein
MNTNEAKDEAMGRLFNIMINRLVATHFITTEDYSTNTIPLLDRSKRIIWFDNYHGHTGVMYFNSMGDKVEASITKAGETIYHGKVKNLQAFDNGYGGLNFISEHKHEVSQLMEEFINTLQTIYMETKIKKKRQTQLV